MVDVATTEAARKELAKKFLDFKYFALFDSTGTEITTNGGQRAEGTVSHDPSTGIVTMSKTFNFTGTVQVSKISPCNSGTAGAGVRLCDYEPAVGSLPESFGNGGSLIVTLTAQMTAPA